ncbi:MAG: hypothetical protein K2P58_04360 [Hyphomonadaceae bacterium]|nr:hypothetical protein [Hyphomonadaceae bacterium]
MSNKAVTPLRLHGLAVLTLTMVALVATGTPEEKPLATVIGWGVPERVAFFAMYVIPVLALVLVLPLSRFTAKGKPQLVRWVIYAVAGMVVGMTLGICLELFTSISPAIAALLGPLSEPTLLDSFLWILASGCVVVGLFLAAIAMFGQSAMQALQVDEVDDPECLEVRRSERGMFGWAALGMATLGVGCAALAAVRQAPEEARLWPAIVAIAACVISAWSNHVLWRGFDEMQRRHVVEGYAVSAIILTLGAFVWAVIQPLALAPPMDASGVFLALIVVQLVATSFVTASVMGQSSMFGKPA